MAAGMEVCCRRPWLRNGGGRTIPRDSSAYQQLAVIICQVLTRVRPRSRTAWCIRVVESVNIDWVLSWQCHGTTYFYNGRILAYSPSFHSLSKILTAPPGVRGRCAVRRTAVRETYRHPKECRRANTNMTF